MANKVKRIFHKMLPGKRRRPLPVMATPNTNVQESAKLAWQAFKMVSANIEKFLDGTPFKIPVSALNTLIEIAETTIDYRESIALILEPIGQRLEFVSRDMERKDHPNGIDSTSERFSNALGKAVSDLKHMEKDGILKRIVKSDEHPEELLKIFQRIDEATKNFQLELTLATFRQVNEIKEDSAIIRLRDLQPRREARFADVKRHGCTPGTRNATIDDIMAWCTDDSPDCPPVYWLSGMAGTGKSTIAYTICEKLYDHGDASRRLGASFFCSRQLEVARLRQNIIPTIVHDLAHSFPDFGRALLASKFDVVPPPLEDHIQSLLSNPWRFVTAKSSLPPLVVVIDALDELKGRDGSLFLEALITEISRHQDGFRGLKFFVTSRQDPRIVDICASIDSRAVCRLEEVPSDIVENDIHLYLCTTLPALNPSTLRTLAQHASGLFIYAATAVRFIIPPSRHEEPTLRKQTERLNLLLRAWPESSECGVDGLPVDCLYEEVLCLWLSPKSKMEQRLARAVLQTIICTEEPILVTDIPCFLESEFDVEEEEASNLILSLHAVLYVSENRAYSYHKSFIDFMYNNARFASQELATLLCPTPERQVCLAISCFRVMSSLRFNICNLPSSYLDDSRVVDLSTRVDKNISYALRYACRYWAKHMWNTSAQLDVEEMLTLHQNWMEDQLLFWIEVMNLLKVIRECYPLLVTARQWLEKNIVLKLEQRKNLIAAENLITFFGSTAMAASTPHLYVSALATYTWESSLISRWRDRFPRIPTVSAILNKDLPLAIFRKPSSFFNPVFLPDGIHVIGTTNGPPGQVFLCDTSTGQFREIAAVAEHDWICSLSVSPDGTHIAGSTLNTVWIWEVPTGKELQRLEYTQVESVVFSRCGTRIAIVDLYGIHIWDTSTWHVLQSRLGARFDATASVCFSPDCTRIAFDTGSTVRIWDLFNGNEVYRLNPKRDEAVSLNFSPDGTQFVFGSGSTVQIWDMSNGNELYRWIMKYHHQVLKAYFSPDGPCIASCSSDTVQIRDASNGNKLHELRPSSDPLISTCFSPDGTQIVLVTETDIELWDLSSGKELHRLFEQDGIYSVSFSSDGTRILSNTGRHLTLWDVPTKKDKQWCQLVGSSTEVLSTHFSPNGKQIVTMSIDSTVHILDATTLTETHKAVKAKREFWNEGGEACFTADGKYIVSPNCQCNASTGKLLEVYERNHTGVELFDCTRSGTLRAEKHCDAPLSFRDISADVGRTNAAVSRSHFTCHGMDDSTEIKKFSFSPNGSRLVTGSKDMTVRIWDTSTGKELGRLEAHSGTVNSVCFSPDGKQIVSGSDDTTMRIWDAPGMQECQCHGSANTSIKFLPDGGCLDSCPLYHSRAATWSFLDSGKIRTDWQIDSDGWVKSSNGERYLWLSKKMHTYLNRPDSVAVSAMGTVEIDFTTGRFGEGWADCYEPSAL